MNRRQILHAMPVTLNVQAGLIAGFIATVVLSMLMIAKSSVGLMPQLNPIEDIVHVAGQPTGMTLPLPFGWIGHFALGTVAWGIIYAALQASLPGAPVVKGLIFGALAWLAMMIIFMPLAGHGLFALSLGARATVATLVLHLIYGAVLGVAYAKVTHE
ncbi:DUF6789 family protein [Bradyrhizobium sp. CER78]|uniref:DUF6789 family protein n=1 Tax=Bradyrhizobium sp. CER78 TaxID=3039162 RepID=UPI002447FE97|nr:DUF6789 family protein [Bradyrhizobium sp. CER78]MDH2383488.1 hypothetical protein [Bradyrhizobium sp. CER78]